MCFLIKMNILLCFTFCFVIFSACNAGVTEIPQAVDEEAVIETVTEDTWMPSNVFEVKTSTRGIQMDQEKIENPVTPDPNWDSDSNPLFKALRDFIFQASDNILETDDHNDDPTEEIAKIIEKGIIEATTMFLTPSDDEQLVSTSEDTRTESISISKIENDTPDSILDRIALNIMNLADEPKPKALSITNITSTCSDCYNTLETCVLQCFVQHNCNDVQRQARECPPPPGRLCNIFTQWGPVDECQAHEDCKSPLLCCSDGCVKKCSTGVWRN